MMTTSHQHTATVLRWIGALGVITVAVLRCLTAIAPQVYFDVDPAFEPAPLAAISIPGSLGLDVLLLLLAGLALLGEWWSGRAIDLKLILLACVPVPIVLWHGWLDASDLWRGSTWMAAMLAAVAVAHLSRDWFMRITLAALLIAVIAPLLLRGAAQVTVEHAETIATFDANREAFLRDQGWEVGSPQALIYERRLRQPQPRGWFDTTNIFASVVGAVGVAFLGFAVGCGRKKLPIGCMAISLLIALLAAMGVWMSGSRGAMLAMLLGSLVCLIPWLTPRVHAWMQRFGSVAFILLPLLALSGIVARGLLLPEGFLNERSLLFRWHYLVSSLGVFADHPVIGTGPDHYQEAYVQHRLPRNPEEVKSPHSVFIDWLCMLGIFASAWIALALTMLGRAGKALRDTATSPALGQDDVESFMGVLAKCTIVLLLLGIVPALLIELHVLDVVTFLPRALGAIGYVALAMMVGFVMVNVERSIASWSIAAAVLGLLVHGQVEMTFFQPNAVVWLMCMLGLLAGNVQTAKRPNVQMAFTSADGRVVGAVCAGLALWIGVTGWLPATLQQREIRAAVDLLHPMPETQREMISRRMRAAEQLIAAYERMPSNHLPLHRAAEQLERAAAHATADERIAILREAHELASRAVHEHGRLTSIGLRARIRAQLANMTMDDGDWERAIADARLMTKRDPHGLAVWERLGDMLWFAERSEEAVDAYQRALDIDANFELDPLKQLSEQRRQQLERRLHAEHRVPSSEM